jgi:hypothetical protein
MQKQIFQVQNKVLIMTQTVQDILNDLSYSLSSPEAQEIYQSIQNKKYAQAKKLLKEHIDEQDAIRVVEFYKKQNAQKYEFVEIEIQDIDLTDYKTQYLFKMGEEIAKSNIEPYRSDDNLCYFMNSKFHTLDKAHQVWKIVIKKN